ncbi:hypothetical protein QAD02_012775 [Eretmocerus hayati]|uniref:Uncharacterized protein n=1 Tax=Eretmocerus hayati TaxID=131215 RepID=A0ACC2P0M6_9HYME|nr:hypothetical protein QAD02_012775 [Eretmocerus hayati]
MMSKVLSQGLAFDDPANSDIEKSVVTDEMEIVLEHPPNISNYNDLKRFAELKNHQAKASREKIVRKDKKTRPLKGMRIGTKVAACDDEKKENGRTIATHQSLRILLKLSISFLQLHITNVKSIDYLLCPDTLRKRYRSKDFQPSVNEEVLKHVSEKVREAEVKRNKKCKFNTTFHEMHLKKLSSYVKASHDWKGYVDSGGQLEERDKNGEKLLATKVLVFTLVNINGSYKISVVYDSTHFPAGLAKSVLLKELLIKLHGIIYHETTSILPALPVIFTHEGDNSA